jgi:flagellar biosynthesis/type III secretory pathway protein FliH
MSTILKAGAAPQAAFDGSHFQLRDLMAEAQAVVLRAREEARRIIADSRAIVEQDAAAARQSGYRAGYDEGSKVGREEGHTTALRDASTQFESEQNQLVSTLQACLEEVAAQRQGLLQEARRDLLGLAIEVAERVTRVSGKLHRDVALENVRAATAMIVAQSDMTISVHPSDLQAVERFANELHIQLGTLSHTKVVAREDVAPGGVIIETEQGRVDATLDRQLERIAAAMTGTEFSE